MRECYHRYCDEADNPNVTELNFDFIANVTQALIYTVAEMTMGNDSTCNLHAYEPKEGEAQDEEENKDVVDDVFTNTLFNWDRVDEDILESEDQAIDEVQYDETGDAGDPDVGPLRDEQSNLGPDHAVGDLSFEEDKELLQLLRQFREEIKHREGSALLSKPSSSESSWFRSTSDSPSTFNIGTQINIGAIHIGLPSSALQNDPFLNTRVAQAGASSYTDYAADPPNVVLGSGDINPDVLTNIIQSYYGQNTVDNRKEPKDRRRYKGKHKNSPMIIKLLSRSRKS